jgi:hypothetical protein
MENINFKLYTVDNLADNCNFMYKNLQSIFINYIITSYNTFILLLQFKVSNCFTCIS